MKGCWLTVGGVSAKPPLQKPPSMARPGRVGQTSRAKTWVETRAKPWVETRAKTWVETRTKL